MLGVSSFGEAYFLGLARLNKSLEFSSKFSDTHSKRTDYLACIWIVVLLQRSDIKMASTHCVAKDCFSTEGLVKFPSINTEKSRKWIQMIRQNLGKPLWSPTRFSAICSKHFESGNLNLTNDCKRKHDEGESTSAPPKKVVKTNVGDFQILSIVEMESPEVKFVDYRDQRADRGPTSEYTKQMNTYKSRLQSLEMENELLRKGLDKIFGDDQISFIKRRGMGEEQPRCVKWSPKTVSTAIKLRLELSDVTYKALLKIGLPLPTIKYLKGYIYKLSLDPKDNSDSIDLEATDEDTIDASKRDEVTKTTENKLSIHTACTSNAQDHSLPYWFQKLPLDIRKRLCYPHLKGQNANVKPSPTQAPVPVSVPVQPQTVTVTATDSEIFELMDNIGQKNEIVLENVELDGNSIIINE